MRNIKSFLVFIFFTINVSVYGQLKFDKNLIPQPVFEEEPGLVELYWVAWEQAWHHVKHQKGLVQELYMDEGLWDDTIWIWDSEFMVMFCKYAPKLFPGIQTLDNFYYTMLEDTTSSLRIQHPDNPPFFAWVESEYYKFTNDKEHIKKLLYDKQFLQRYFHWFDNLSPGMKLNFDHVDIALKKKEFGYNWGGIMSGMDNTPRGRGYYNELLWVDAISQQALSALYITRLAKEFKHKELVSEFSKRYDSLKNIINKYYWNNSDGIYYDIKESNLEHVKVKTPASFWPMLAEIPSREQAEKMLNLIRDENLFGGQMPWVTVSRDDPDFNSVDGDYWRGAIWLPTAYMGIKALEKYGFYEDADKSAYNVVKHQYNTYKTYSPATIWECYSPSEPKPSTNKGERVRTDFCGWSALGPISLFIENILGFHKVDAQKNIVEWRKYQKGVHGIKNLSFGDIITDIVAKDGYVEVKSNKPYTLIINGKGHKVNSGSNIVRN